MKYYYKALFAREKDGGFTVTFPDVEEVVTYGDTIEEAVEMAKQCLGMCLETREMEGKEFPKATYGDLECEKNCFYMLIEFDLLEYKKKYNRKSIRKNVTIPAWLNELAEASNVNFSNVLQNALIKELNLD
jgi:predicted RNase H-like HicB family nuclease